MTINTHENLLKDLLDSTGFRVLKRKGFEGEREDFISCLLYAMQITSMLNTSNCGYSQIDYFNLLIKEMNNAL